MQSFILPANGKATPDSIARKRKMAEAMLASGMDASPIASPWQGAARMAQALVGGLASRRADQQDAALQDETKKEQMARQLLLDNRYNSEQSYAHDQDALNNARARSSDAMQQTLFHNLLDDRQLGQDRLAAQQGVYQGQINQTNTHQGGMQGPQQPSYSPEQFNQAQMAAAGGDYGKAGELLNPMSDPSLKPTSNIQEYEYGVKQGFKGSLQEWEALKQGGLTIQSDGHGGFTLEQGGAVGKPKAPTEAMIRARGFKESMKSSLASLKTNFEAIASPQNYVGDTATIAGGRAMMTPEGQMASDNFNEVVGSMLYVASGATLNPSEIERKMITLKPYPNDDKQTIALKRLRLGDLERAIDVMAGLDQQEASQEVPQQAPQPLPQGSAAPGGKTSTGVPWSISP